MGSKYRVAVVVVRTGRRARLPRRFARVSCRCRHRGESRRSIRTLKTAESRQVKVCRSSASSGGASARRRPWRIKGCAASNHHIAQRERADADRGRRPPRVASPISAGPIPGSATSAATAVSDAREYDGVTLSLAGAACGRPVSLASSYKPPGSRWTMRAMHFSARRRTTSTSATTGVCQTTINATGLVWSGIAGGSAAKGLQIAWLYTYGSPQPFNIVTGGDRNNDTNVNDRPEGVARNTGVGFDYSALDLRLSAVRFAISGRSAHRAHRRCVQPAQPRPTT